MKFNIVVRTQWQIVISMSDSIVLSEETFYSTDEWEKLPVHLKVAYFSLYPPMPISVCCIPRIGTKNHIKRMRNPSKNTIKKIMRSAVISNQHSLIRGNYFLWNEVGARVYTISKKQICNIEPKGYNRYLTPKNKKNE